MIIESYSVKLSIIVLINSRSLKMERRSILVPVLQLLNWNLKSTMFLLLRKGMGT